MTALANVVTKVVTKVPASGLRTHPIRLALDIRDEHKAAQHDHLSAVKHAIRCGQLLLEAKAGLNHGQWELWCKAQVPFSYRTAQGYMRLAKLDPAKAQRVADLSLRQALKDIGQEYGRKQKQIERQVDRELEVDSKPLVLDAEVVRVDDDDVPVQQPARVGPTSARVNPKHDVETIIDAAAFTINRWFADTAPEDHGHLADAIRQIIADHEEGER